MDGPAYKMRFLHDGTVYAEIVDMLYLSYMKEVNAAGACQFRLRDEHPVAASVQTDDVVEVWRQYPVYDAGETGSRVLGGSSWYRDWIGIFREPEQRDAQPGIFIGRAVGPLSLLADRIVAWYAGTANRSAFSAVKAETISKTLVLYNAGANAAFGAGRLLNGTIANLTNETDGGGGNTITIGCAYANLLSTLQDTARVGGGDFDLVETAPLTYQFRWYAGQLGADKSATVTFSIGNGNMAKPTFRRFALHEKTAAIVGGRGEGADRLVVVRNSADHHATTNHREVFVDANDLESPAGLNARGDQRLDELKKVSEFTFDVLQTPAVAYGRDYALGDLVTTVSPFDNVAYTQKIRRVGVVLDPDSRTIENINIETETA
jgi:hypothetical protein